MKRKIFLTVATLLFSCYFAFAQNGGIPVELKPFNPPTKPPFGNVTTPYDTLKNKNPFSLTKEIIFYCYQNSSHITLQCNNDERVEVVIYEMLSGVKHTSIINMVENEIYTIDTPWSTGLYTIRLILSNGTILEGDFQIK